MALHIVFVLKRNKLTCFIVNVSFFVQDGNTVLMEAVKNNRFEIAELLLKFGANIDVNNKV